MWRFSHTQKNSSSKTLALYFDCALGTHKHRRKFITTDTGDSNNKNIFIYYILFPLKWIANIEMETWEIANFRQLFHLNRNIDVHERALSRPLGLSFYRLRNVVRYISSLFWIIIMSLISSTCLLCFSSSPVTIDLNVLDSWDSSARASY